MQRGAKPKPQALKELHGTERKDRTRIEPETPGGDLIPPEQLARLKWGMDYWDHIVARAPLGILKPIDVPLLFRLCVALALAHDALDKVMEAGLVVMVGQEKTAAGVITKQGTPQQNPYLPIVNKQTEIARKLAAELGLPVTARARLDFGDMLPTAPPQGTTSAKTDGDRPTSFRAYIATNPQATRH